MDAQGAVGIFWWIEKTLLAAGCPLDEAEPYGDNLTYDGGHAEHWDRWRNAGSAWLKAHGMPVCICSTEYDSHPRGRIVKTPESFIIYADRRIQSAGMIAIISHRFGLDGLNIEVRSDQHYR